MTKLIVLWNKPQPETYKRILFRYGDDRKWRYWENWKFNCDLRNFMWNVIVPFLRFTKCNRQFEIGLGNHYFEIGW